MSAFQSIEEARAYFEGDRFARESGITLDELACEQSVCSMPLTDRHRNAEGGVMGGAIFTLIDFAFAVAANNTHRPTVAQQVSVNFLSGSRGSRLIATASCKKNGKTSCVYNVDVVDDLGRDIAQAVVTGFKL
ncbi:MAG: PaaI family thioesterase [Clostridia bacterium]|nr:PaaI family thioesterase [Clostridia bacterium]MBO4886222.1 PaaI family thioesterase [Clostridia bacterium]MBR4442203.1 PaaI family thioesterase [Clostridia bacterium]